MNDALKERVKRAVLAGREARSAYYNTIQLPDEQQLGPPATEHQIQAVERWFGKPVPLSYRTFLSLHNGWRMVEGDMALLSTQEMLEGPAVNKIRKWQEQARQDKDAVAARSLVIGLDNTTPSKLLLDPGRVAGGEWALIQYHDEEEGEYPSFLNWLEASVTEFKELIDEHRKGEG